jgi:hypothetical protein
MQVSSQTSHVELLDEEEELVARERVFTVEEVVEKLELKLEWEMEEVDDLVVEKLEGNEGV